jgi:hypothetical protein
MTNADIELLAGLSLECDDGDRPGAADPRSAACLSMTRLSALSESPASASAAERAHLAACRLCAARSRAFAGPATNAETLVATSRPPRRHYEWLGALGAAAACLLVWTLARPPAPGPVPARIDAPERPVRLEAAVCIRGDSNCDGVTDAKDLSAFVVAMNHPEQYAVQYPDCDLVCSNDMNGDREVDDFDLAQLVQCIGG